MAPPFIGQAEIGPGFHVVRLGNSGLRQHVDSVQVFPQLGQGAADRDAVCAAED
jgi:hypothetical protein